MLGCIAQPIDIGERAIAIEREAAGAELLAAGEQVAIEQQSICC